jgi:hypothetical protein
VQRFPKVIVSFSILFVQYLLNIHRHHNKKAVLSNVYMTEENLTVIVVLLLDFWVGLSV